MWRLLVGEALSGHVQFAVLRSDVCLWVDLHPWIVLCGQTRHFVDASVLGVTVGASHEDPRAVREQGGDGRHETLKVVPVYFVASAIASALDGATTVTVLDGVIRTSKVRVPSACSRPSEAA